MRFMSRVVEQNLVQHGKYNILQLGKKKFILECEVRCPRKASQ